MKAFTSVSWRFSRIPSFVTDTLIQPDVVQGWAPYSLKERSQILQQLFPQHPVSTSTIRRFYLAHKIKYRASQLVYRKALTD